MSERSLPTLAWGAATHPGRVREGNEDAFIAEPMVFVVADGMGGHAAGEVASAIAATTLRDRLSAGAASVDVAVAAVVEANASIFQGAHTHLDQRGMGTTLTAVVVLPHTDAGARLAVLNVGDSRTYVLRNGRLRRVTVDHSYVQELVSTGHISEAEARNHPRRNIVTRALGIEPSVRVDTWVVPFVRGDRYVLCSDGLVDEVADADIAKVLKLHASPQAAAEALVEAALNNGGRDNVTVVVLDSLEGDDPPRDDSDLNIDLSWDEEIVNERLTERMVDAEAAALGDLLDDRDGRDGRDAAGDPTQPAAVVPHAYGRVGARMRRAPQPSSPHQPRRRLSVGVVLFAVAVVAIVAAAVTLVFVIGGDDEAPPVTTTETTTATTVRATTTTIRSTTTTGPFDFLITTTQPTGG